MSYPTPEDRHQRALSRLSAVARVIATMVHAGLPVTESDIRELVVASDREWSAMLAVLDYARAALDGDKGER
ncbi:MAG TPA: hypothetical protein VMW48_13465 [Vicinamibacterales bacterium]|nr:hypothetical protein [Vicinamibacterales bacterium]